MSSRVFTTSWHVTAYVRVGLVFFADRRFCLVVLCGNLNINTLSATVVTENTDLDVSRLITRALFRTAKVCVSF